MIMSSNDYDHKPPLLGLQRFHNSIKYFRSRLLIRSITVELAYFLLLSLVGFLALKLCKPRSAVSDFDLLFTSISAATVSSMSTVEMEVFSNAQLIIITLLMLLGGEVFVSMLALHLKCYYRYRSGPNHDQPENEEIVIELGGMSSRQATANNDNHISNNTVGHKRQNWGRSLSSVVLGYLVVVHTVCALAVWTYLSVVSTARRVLEKKSISSATFSVMMVVSTFANCGFTPNNENMGVFVGHSGLLLLLSPLILLGNTLYPVALRLVLHGLHRLTGRSDFRQILDDHHTDLGDHYDHLLPPSRTRMLAVTALGFLALQLLLFCSMEWTSGALPPDLTPYQRLVASFFQVINSRHAGESVVDLSTISTAVLVVFIIMMYLPPYTTFFPWNNKDEDSGKEKKSVNAGFSIHRVPQLGYLAIFITMVCITERHKLRDDPLNFNLLTVTIEIVRYVARDIYII